MTTPATISKTIFIIPLSILLAILGTAACATSDVVVEESDRDSIVGAKRGDFLSLALPSDPEAGMAWVVISVEENMLREEEQPLFIMRSDTGEAPGIDLFRYRVMADGETNLSLEYKHTQDGRTETLQTFNVTIMIGQ